MLLGIFLSTVSYIGRLRKWVLQFSTQVLINLYGQTNYARYKRDENV